MPDYLVLPDEATVRQRSRDMAAALNCGPTTQYWFSWITHPDGRAALAVPTEAEDKVHAERGRPELTGTELANLKRPLPDDWFPDEDSP